MWAAWPRFDLEARIFLLYASDDFHWTELCAVFDLTIKVYLKSMTEGYRNTFFDSGAKLGHVTVPIQDQLLYISEEIENRNKKIQLNKGI